jgi:hypothetical protein
MGEWKTQMSLRVEPEFRRKFVTFCEKERRKESELGRELLLWAVDQLERAGSLTNLLKYHLGKPKETDRKENS